MDGSEKGAGEITYSVLIQTGPHPWLCSVTVLWLQVSELQMKKWVEWSTDSSILIFLTASPMCALCKVQAKLFISPLCIKPGKCSLNLCWRKDGNKDCIQSLQNKHMLKSPLCRWILHMWISKMFDHSSVQENVLCFPIKTGWGMCFLVLFWCSVAEKRNGWEGHSSTALRSSLQSFWNLLCLLREKTVKQRLMALVSALMLGRIRYSASLIWRASCRSAWTTSDLVSNKNYDGSMAAKDNFHMTMTLFMLTIPTTAHEGPEQPASLIYLEFRLSPCMSCCPRSLPFCLSLWFPAR